MKIEFDLLEDRAEVQTILNANKHYALLHNIQEEVRRVWKYDMSHEDFYNRVKEHMEEFQWEE